MGSKYPPGCEPYHPAVDSPGPNVGICLMVVLSLFMLAQAGNRRQFIFTCVITPLMYPRTRAVLVNVVWAALCDRAALAANITQALGLFGVVGAAAAMFMDQVRYPWNIAVILVVGLCVVVMQGAEDAVNWEREQRWEAGNVREIVDGLRDAVNYEL